MVIVFPAVTKRIIDDVIGEHHPGTPDAVGRARGAGDFSSNTE